MVIVCEKTGVEIRIDKTNGGKGRINAVRIYDRNKKLQVVNTIYLNGNEVETKKINENEA